LLCHSPPLEGGARHFMCFHVICLFHQVFGCAYICGFVIGLLSHRQISGFTEIFAATENPLKNAAAVIAAEFLKFISHCKKFG